jgi:hypothetical protein
MLLPELAPFDPRQHLETLTTSERQLAPTGRFVFDSERNPLPQGSSVVLDVTLNDGRIKSYVARLEVISHISGGTYRFHLQPIAALA